MNLIFLLKGSNFSVYLSFFMLIISDFYQIIYVKSLIKKYLILDYALNNSIMLGFVTTTTRGNVTEILKATNVDSKIFNVITTGDVVEKPKPDPDAYNTALKKLGLLPDQAIAVEDNLDGYYAAIKATLECVAFPGSMQHEEAFAKITQVSSNVAQSVIDAVESRIAA